MKTPLLAGAAVALALTAGAATAQPAQSQHRPAADRDGDQRISRDEFLTQRRERLTRLDANRDGRVTQDEARAGRQRMAAEMKGRMFDRLDADKNGAISRQEFEAAHGRRAGRADGDHGPGAGGHGGRRMLGHGGPDGGHGGMMGRGFPEGGIVIADAERKAAEHFAQLDADNDGYVTREERRAKMHERRGGHGRHGPARPHG